ncbi:LysR family transcriptional regulator [Paenibacillus caui]|uniref:LysR family transcriptional regulator n=1 Tax=Paenibacillus caui TaxID=2873927 RepID=UPI001F365C8F|nr:LysR family transcriptional regulator [Paenibacillus caui]
MTYFMAVCEELHFTKAAEKMGISQPNLSLQIKALEDEIGVPLFDRIGKRISLTEAGAVLLKHCKDIFQNMENAKSEISELREHYGGRLTISLLPSELDYRLTPLLIDFHHQFPKVLLKTLSSVEIVRQVLDMEADIGIAPILSSDDRLVIIPLYQEEYVLLVSQQHELADSKSISLAELKKLPLIMYPKGFIGREGIENHCREHGVELNTIVETSSNMSLFQFVRENIGATIQTYPLAESISAPDLRIIPITDHPPLRKMGIIYRADKYLGRAAQQFIQIARERLSAPASSPKKELPNGDPL